MEERHDKILSDAIMDAIGAAIGMPIGASRRIILDAQIGQPVRVYVEFLGDTRMLGMELPAVAIEDIILARLEGKRA